MKKIILSVATLSAALAQAQVGINQEVPKATLDISVKKDNIDTNSQEGLLIPRVTKEKALKMANNSTAPEESVLIYVNDVASFTSPADEKVNDITEKGYYFWNGAKWVKSSGANGQEWVYDDATKQINLKRSGQGEFKNSVFYSGKGYQYSFDENNLQDIDYLDNSQYQINFLDNGNSYVYQKNSNNIEASSRLLSSKYKIKKMKNNTLNLSNDDQADRFTATESNLLITPEVTNDFYFTIGGEGNILNSSNGGDLKYSSGLSGSVFLKNTARSTGYSWGNRGFAYSSTSGDIRHLAAFGGYTSVAGSGTIDRMSLYSGAMILGASDSSTIKELEGVGLRYTISKTNQSQIQKIVGFNYVTPNNYPANTSIENHYGIYIDDIKGANISNYAIYTGVGDVRLGQFKDDNATGNRLLTVDSDGKLVVGESTQSVAPFWSYVPSENKIKLNYLSDGVTPRNENNGISINDDGALYTEDIISRGWQRYIATAPAAIYVSDGNRTTDINFNNRWLLDNFKAISNDNTPTFTGRLRFDSGKGEFIISGSSSTIAPDQPAIQNKVFKIDMINQSVKVGKLNDNTPNNRTLIAVNENGSAGIYKIGTPQIGDELGKIDLGLTAGGLYESLASIKTISAGDAYVASGTVSKIGGHMSFSTTPLSYDLTNDMAVPQERMRITSNGNIGIGTQSPTEKLEVDGKIKASSLAGTGERIVTANTDGVLQTSTTSLSDLESLWANDDANNLVKLKATSNGTPRVNTPGSRNDVTIDNDGKITARGFVGYNGATIFPDYVFEKYYTGESTIKADYNFHNLASVESFIKTNGHLPGYTSAKEIAEKGLIDLGATQLTNVEKIEELYLHTIEQEKALKAKDAKIEKLESELQAQKYKINSQEERLSKLEQLLK